METLGQSINQSVVQLRREAALEVKRLSHLNEWKALWATSFCWICVAASIFFSLRINNWIAYFFAVLVIAARQHGMLALMHEGVHQRLAKKDWLNDGLSDLFNAFPIGMRTAVYRKHHILHHRYLNGDRDPDWVRKSPLEDWKFPMTGKRFIKLYSRYLYGYGIYETMKLCKYLSGMTSQNFSLSDKKAIKDLLSQSFYYAVVAAALTYFKMWNIFFLYWIVPFLTIFPILMRLRSVAEHFGLPRTNDLNGTRNILSPGLERFFVVPFSLSYHLTHHLFPTIPFYNLKEANEMLLRYSIYRDNAPQNSSYLGFSKTSLSHDLFRKSEV